MSRSGGLTDRVRAWRATGATEDVGGHSIFARRTAGRDPALVFLHGFPSSSYDFRGLLALLEGHQTLALDFLGFGLSQKPPIDNSLFRQADLVEELAARHLGERELFLVAHDMGTSVATELLARDLDGAGHLRLAGALLFNGSIVLERASLTAVQRLLRSPLGPLAARLSSERLFRRQFAALFSEAHPLTDAEAADQWSLIRRGGGRTLGHRLITYLGERVEHAERWHGAIRDWPGDLSFAWGLRDPVATTSVLEALRELRPAAPVTELGELGHYPQLEDPGAVAGALRAALDRAPPGPR